VHDGPVRELAIQLGVRGGGADDPLADGIVLSVGTYSGRAPTDLWEWLRAKGA